MARQDEIVATYDYMDEYFRACLGDHADITCALYEGDFSLTLEQAQRRKHEFILRELGFREGTRVLDIGCGWGPVLRAVATQRGKGVGLTLSLAQAAACRARGLDARVQDWKTFDVEPGAFDAVVSVGAFEHFCSREEYRAGEQDAVYDRFFALCSKALPSRGRLFLQTMTWGKQVPNEGDIDVRAPKLSSAWVLGHLEKFYPGSWLPNGLEHLTRVASPWFRLVWSSNGQRDYIKTMNEWSAAIDRVPWATKLRIASKALPRFVTDRTFRQQITSLRYSCNQLCFERDLMSHERIVFEKVG